MQKAKAVFLLPGPIVCNTSITMNARGHFFTQLSNFRNKYDPRIPFSGARDRRGHIHFVSRDRRYPDTVTVAPSWRGAIYASPELKTMIHLRVEEFQPYVARDTKYFRVFTQGGMLVVSATKREHVATWAEQHGYGRPWIEGATWLDVNLWQVDAEVIDVRG